MNAAGTIPAQFYPQALIVAYAAGCAATWLYLAGALTLERIRDPRAYDRFAATLLARGSSPVQVVSMIALAWPLFLSHLASRGYDRPDNHHTPAGVERAPARKAHR